MAETRGRRRVTLTALITLAICLTVAAPANAELFDRFITSGNATARWVEDPSTVPAATDQQAIELAAEARSAIDLNDAAWVTFDGFPTAPPATPPAFMYKVSHSGFSGGSLRLVMRFSDGGYGFLRPVFLEAGAWRLQSGATRDWESRGGAPGCSETASFFYAEMLACHPGTTVTSLEVINDSGWVSPGNRFTTLVDFISYGGELVTTPAPPVLGENLNATQTSGKVLVRLPDESTPGPAGTSQATPQVGPSDLDRLDGIVQGLPLGSRIDTRRGAVRLITARGRKRRQSGRFSGAVFTVTQSKTRGGLTTLRLKKAPRGRCRPRARRSQLGGPIAQDSTHRRRFLRRLRARARGRFRTRGRYSSAIVSGTRWTLTERCSGTLISVSEGAMSVRDLRRKRTVIVRAGQSYLARAPGY